MGTIVVGVDHSEGAKAALRFALEEAMLRKATLLAVHAWQFGSFGPADIEGYFPASGADLSDAHAPAAAALDATLREAIPYSRAVTVERRVVEGAPAAVLVETSQDADLLVVGSRGHGGFAGLRAAKPQLCVRPATQGVPDLVRGRPFRCASVPE